MEIDVAGYDISWLANDIFIFIFLIDGTLLKTIPCVVGRRTRRVIQLFICVDIVFESIIPVYSTHSNSRILKSNFVIATHYIDSMVDGRITELKEHKQIRK